MFWFSNDTNSKVIFKVLNNTDDNIFITRLFSKDMDIKEMRKSLSPNYNHLFQIESSLFHINKLDSTSIYILFTDPHGKTHKFLVYENLEEDTYVYIKVTIFKTKLGDYEISMRDLISHPEC